MSLLNLIKFSAMTLFGSLVSLMLVPILLPVIIVSYLLSLCAHILIKIKFGNKVSKASGTDVLSGKETEISRPIINIAFRFKGNLDLVKFRSGMLDLLDNSIASNGEKRYKRMLQIYKKAFGYGIWMDYPEFRVEEHVTTVCVKDLVKNSIENELKTSDNGTLRRIEQIKKIIEDPDNIDWTELMKIFLNIYAYKEMENGLPKWEVLLIKESEKRYSALYRFHHSISDGIYLSRMLCEGLLNSPKELSHTYTPPTILERYIQNFWSFSLLPFGLWKIIQNKDKNILHGPKLSGIKKHYLSRPIQQSDLRFIRTKTRASVYGSLFSCFSYSIASHFKKRNTSVPNITTLIPVPLQNLLKEIKLKNKYAVMSLKIPTPIPVSGTLSKDQGVEGSSLGRLRNIQKTLSKSKQDPAFLSVHSLIKTICSCLPSSAAETLLSAKGCTANFSSLAGPARELFYDKDTIEEIMFWIPDRDPLGVAVSILSYNSQLRVGLTIDQALLEEEQEGDIFLNNFLQELENLKEIAGEKSFDYDDGIVEERNLLKNIA